MHISIIYGDFPKTLSLFTCMSVKVFVVAKFYKLLVSGKNFKFANMFTWEENCSQICVRQTLKTLFYIILCKYNYPVSRRLSAEQV